VKFSVGGTMGMSWDESRDAAQAADELGFDEFYTSDHLMAVAGFDAEKGLLDAVALLPALAAHTRRVRLGCLVSPVTYRNPTIMLRQIQALDLVSGGRAIMGVGAGWSETEHRRFGFAFPPIQERMRLLEDACRLTRELWPELRPRAPQERVRLLVAGASPSVLRIAAKYADAWHAIGTPAFLAEKIAALRTAEKEVGRAAGRPVETTVNLMATVSEDEAVLAAVRERLAKAAPTRGSERAQKNVAVPGDSDPTGMFVGRPQELGRHVARYADAGVDRVILATPKPFTREALALLARAAGLGA
jgi:alkanesulfonate monooxygenase SsuD/methylene tetrahydromethanopterin reductase-like flavin-dependent oxidoreductase (luciferase family)